MSARPDHEAMAAIEAALSEAVYDAMRRARLQRLGRLPVPTPSGRAWSILARSRAGRQGVYVPPSESGGRLPG
jgi:hypothetical protein